MLIESFEHPFFDIDVETVDESANVHLIKILAIDGRRFTYQLTGDLDADAILYIKSVIDAVCFSDMVIERDGAEYSITEATRRLKQHS